MSGFRKIILGLGLAVALTASGVLVAKTHHGHDAPETEVPQGLDEGAMQELARRGGGFIVWERFRAGSWQIWTKELRGGKEERLVPPEPGKDHFCPKISPDGKQLAYLSYKQGVNAYPACKGTSGTLWIMDLLTQERRVAADRARSYAEDRAVTWRDGKTLCFINAEGETMELKLDTGAARKVLQYNDSDFGLLPSPDLRHATSGTPEFAKVGPDGSIVHQKINDGCQPYFTSDSRWGFWMGGAGGPVEVVNLETGEEKSLLDRDDPRLPERRNYIYFPMISPCMRLLAFAASPDMHDHFAADYDIYVALLNPRTMTVLGRPVRYTKFSGCDRFPDVFRNELPLGTHFVEGETTVIFEGPKNKGVYEFDFGDGGHAHGPKVRHTFRKPGDYWVKAVSAHENGRNLDGFVHVDPPAAPRVIEVRRDGGQKLIVEFNEGIDVSKTKARLGRHEALPFQLAEGGRSLSFSLPASLPRDAAVILEGIRDLAQHPNVMARQTLRVPRTDWPTLTNRLVFTWAYAKSKNQLPDGMECRVVPHGLAFWNEDEVMQLRGGSFNAPEAGPRISEAVRKSGAFTMEAVITPQQSNKGREIEPIVMLGDSRDDANFIIGQRGFQLCVGWRGHTKSDRAKVIWQDVANIAPGGGHHLLVTCEKNSATLYLDGRPKDLSGEIKAGIPDWKSQALRFGVLLDGSHPWRGLIERVAIYDRAFNHEEALTNAKEAAAIIDARAKPRSWEVLAKLKESSAPPTLQEIQPYKEALVRQLYEVQKVVGGDGNLPNEIVVTQWAWLGDQAMPSQALKVGDVVKLNLHEMEIHRELSALMVRDTLGSGFDARQFFDAGEWDEPIEKQH